MTPDICVVVHPIDTDAHPSQPAGFRWAVMAGTDDPRDMNRCANAGWAPNATAAWLEGEQAGATACRALRILGVPSEYRKLQLESDPIPGGLEPVHVL